MSEDLSLFDDACLPPKTPYEAGFSAQSSYSKLDQFGAFPPVSGVSSPFSTEDLPRQSIEMDLMENKKPAGMFITPELDDRHNRDSVSISIYDTPEVDYRLQVHNSHGIERDCMIVDEDDCSPEARKKWLNPKSKQKTSARRNLGDAVIKTEHGIGSVRPANLIEIQKRLISQHNAARLHKSGASTFLGSKKTRSIILSPSPIRRPRPQRGTLYQQRGLDNIVDVKEEFESIMRREDDMSWMEENDNDGGVEELEKLEMLKRSFEGRQKSKGLSEVETIEFMKVNQQIELQRRRKEAVERNYKFVSSDDDDGDGPERFLRESLYAQSIEDEQTALATETELVRETNVPTNKSKPNISKKSTKGRGRKVGKTAREVQEIRREKEREKERKKRARAANSKRAQSKGKGFKKSGLKKKQYLSHMKRGWGDERESLQALLQDLVHNDFVADRQAQGDYGEAPEIHETTKEKALRALLASVPADYDTHKAKADKRDLKEASKRFGYGRVKNVDGKWKLSGMKSPLYHHQLIGADWMLTRELGVQPPFGGLLADAMGLGKTLQTLATMVGNPPSKEHIKAKTKATLIVLPSSAIRQWQDEIATHVDAKIFPRIMHYKAKKEIPLISLQDCDIVLTSYAEVMASFPYPSADDVKNFASNGGYNRWREKCKDITGDLHRMQWYRIVLDEAHAIKNFKSRTSLACQNLLGKYRWASLILLTALSGTPIQNRLDELFPYLRFLRAPWTADYMEFRKHFCDPDAEDSMARISVILSIVMRRTMKDKILGRPIVELPPIHPDTQYISFSAEERVLYRLLEDKFRENINKHFAEGTAERSYGTFMVQILRLRQCTAHPFLLESTVKEVFNLEDVTRLQTEWGRLSRYRQPMYEQINQWVQQSEEERLAAHARGEPTLGPGEKQPFGQSEFGKYFRMGKVLESLNSKDLKQRVVCRLCGDLPNDALMTDCHHVFCRNCLENYLASETLRGVNTEYDQCPEPSCRKIFKQAISYKDLNLPDDEVNSDGSDGAGYNKSTRKRGKRSREANEPLGYSSWFETCARSKDKYIPPSAKTVAFKAKILKWINEAPNDKIIIFTQWRVMAKIVGMICEMEKWGFVYFTGDMNLEQRHANVKRFHADLDIKIMIAGLKCGGQALNLSCANRVISIDLWWNHSIEQQAFGRVFRIGQHKETYVSRFVIRNSIDCRILSMQADKIQTIDRAMQDTDGSIVEPLSMADLASLFGHLREEDDGTFRVERDYEKEDGDEDDESHGSEPEEEPQMC